MGDDIAIRVEGVSKSFRLPHEKAGSIKSALLGWRKRKRGYEMQHVLEDVSFEIKKGEFFGIVGRNGSGKSTLLKLISQIYSPDKGHIQVNGKLTPFIELGVGFNPELSGRDNVYLNGALLGFNRKEMDAMYDEIVEFAELERFMDQKLKNYSSGMQVRLAFSVAIRANPDILVLDEVLAVGDEAFQRKCREYFYRLKKEKRTVILVTHSMESVRNFCDRGILIDKGNIIESGSPDKIASRYSNLFQKEYVEKKRQELAMTKNYSNKDNAYIETIGITQDDKSTKIVEFRNNFSITMTILSDRNYEDLVMGVHLANEAGQIIVAMSTKTFCDSLELRTGKNTLRFDIHNVLAEGEYAVNVVVKQKATGTFLIQESGACSFIVSGIDTSKYNPVGLVYPDVKFSIK